MMRISTSLVLALLLGLITSEAAARKWTSRNGSFTVEAELVDVVDGKAVLKKEDGKEISVPLEKLSLRDVRYIQETLKSATESVTGKDEKAKPSEPKEEAKDDAAARDKPQPAKDAEVSTEGGPPLAKEDSTEWQVKPDPAKEPFALAPDAKVKIPLPKNAFGLKVLFSSQMSPFVMLGTTGPDAAGEIWDLRTGQQAGRITEKLDLHDNVALSPDGLHLASAARSPEGCIQIWSFKTGKVDRKIPLDSSMRVRSLGYCGPDRLFVAASGVKEGVTIWDLRTGKVSVEYKCEPSSDKNALAVSPGGNYLAIAPSSKPPRIIDVRNGVEAGQLQAERSKGAYGMSVTALAFSPDGKELAGLFQDGSGTALIAWDMATGEIAVDHRFVKDSRSLSTGTLYDGYPLDWLADRSGWLLYGTAVIDRKKGGPIWTDPSRTRDKARIPRRVLDGDRILSAEEDGGANDSALALRLISLPKAEIAASAKVVEAGGKAADAGLPPLTKIDRSAEKKVDFVPVGEWAYQPRTLLPGDLVQSPVSIDLDSSHLIRVEMTGVEAAKALVANNPTSRTVAKGLPFGPRACDRYDLRTGKRLDHFDVPFPTQLVDFCPDGNLALFKVAQGNDRLDVYSLEGAKHVVGFRPYFGAPLLREQVTAAAFIDAKHVLTSDIEGRIVCWSLPDCKAVYSCDSRGRWIAFSPDRRAYLMMADSAPFLVESLTGRVVGRLGELASVGRQYLGCAAFRSDGRKLAATVMIGEGTVVAVWDLASGKAESECWVPAAPHELYWASPTHLLVREMDPQNEDAKARARRKEEFPLDKQSLLLVDMEKKRVVWKYQLGLEPECNWAPDGRFWYVASQEFATPAKLVPLALPEPAALPVINAAPPIKPILAAGGKVSLSVKLDLAIQREGSNKVRDLLDKFFRDALTRNEITVDPQAPIAMSVVLKERIGEEEMRQLTERRDTHVVQPLEVRCEIIIAEPGKAGWSQIKRVTREEYLMDSFSRDAAGVPPAFLSDNWRKAIVWCKECYLPKEVYPSTAYQGSGESKLTSEGAVPLKKQ